MRWKITKINIGDIRTIRRFLWFPLKLGNEIRWLEFANIKQEYKEMTAYDDFGSVNYQEWRNINFTNDEVKP